MKKLCFICGVVALSALAQVANSDTFKEVNYRDKPLGAWLRQLVEFERRWDYEEAEEAVKGYLTEAKNAIPVILSALRDADANLRWGAIRALKISDEEDTQCLPALKKAALKDASVDVRREAISTLGHFRSATDEAQAVFLEVVKNDPEPEIRSWALSAIRRLEQPNDSVIPAVREALKDPSSKVRVQAAHALAELGTAENVTPLLIRTLVDDKEEDVREAASLALADLGSAAAPFLQEALAQKSDIGQARAALTLGRIDSTEREANGAVRAAVPVAAQLLSARDRQVRLIAAQALGYIAYRMADDAAPAIPALIAAVKDDDARVRNESILALGSFGFRAEPAVPALIRCLQDKDPTTRGNVAQSLGWIGPKAKAAVPDLIAILRDKHQAGVRWSAADALAGIGLEAKTAVPALKEALQDKDKVLRNRAGRALKAVDPVAAAEAGIR